MTTQRGKAMEKEEIAYQNKDITSKMLAENFKGKSFRVYGLDLLIYQLIQQAFPIRITKIHRQPGANDWIYFEIFTAFY